MVRFADDNARSHRHRAVKILLQVVTHHAIRAAAVANAPVVEQRNTPDVLADIIGRNILAALADNNGNFAFIVEIGDAPGKRYGFIRPGDFGGYFPTPPLAAFFRLFRDLLDGYVGLAETVRPHAGQMSRIVAADAGDAPLRPRRVQLDIARVVYDFRLAAFIAGRDLGELLDHALRIFQTGRPGLDERQ